MTWLGRTDQWKRHTRPDVRTALKEAKEREWLFREGGHFGAIKCPHPDHETCKFTIVGTPDEKGGTWTAKLIRQKLNRCPGAPKGPTPAALEAALQDVSTLLDAAEMLLRSDEMETEALEALERAGAADDPEAELEAAITLQEERDAQFASAWGKALAAGAGEPWPPTERAKDLAQTALDRLGEIEAALADGGDEALAQIAALRVRAERFLA